MLEITLANLCSTNTPDTAELPKGNGNKGRPLNAQDNLAISDLSGWANLGIRSACPFAPGSSLQNADCSTQTVPSTREYKMLWRLVCLVLSTRSTQAHLPSCHCGTFWAW